jgi:hypothetical protein
VDSPALQELFARVTPWGLTIGQTAVTVLIAVGLLTILGFARVILRLSAAIMQIGCLLILLCLCSAVGAMVYINFQRPS